MSSGPEGIVQADVVAQANDDGVSHCVARLHHHLGDSTVIAATAVMQPPVGMDFTRPLPSCGLPPCTVKLGCLKPIVGCQADAAKP